MNEFEFLNLDQITNGIFVHILIFKKRSSCSKYSRKLRQRLKYEKMKKANKTTLTVNRFHLTQEESANRWKSSDRLPLASRPCDYNYFFFL